MTTKQQAQAQFKVVSEQTAKLGQIIDQLDATTPPVDPPVTPPGDKPSAEGTVITNPGQTLIAADGAKWTITADRIALRNGTRAGENSDVQRLKVASGICARNASNGNWWRWTGNGWTLLGTTEPGGGGTTPPVDPPVTPPSGKDEVLTAALIRSRGTGQHECIPDTAEVSPSWGIIINGQFDPNTNPTNGEWPSTPPNISDRQNAMGWAVFDGINKQTNTSSNAGIKIYRAGVACKLRNGQTRKVEGYNVGELTKDLGMVYDGTQVPLVNGLVAGIGRRDGVWRERNWHPTFNEMAFGQAMAREVRSTLVFIQAGFEPLNPSEPMDADKYPACFYAGDDNYVLNGQRARQDGFSGKFIQVREFKRWNGKFWGENSADLDELVALVNAG